MVRMTADGGGVYGVANARGKLNRGRYSSGDYRDRTYFYLLSITVAA